MTTFDSLQRVFQEDKDLVTVFVKVLQKHLKKKGKKKGHLQFAKQTTYGWSFFTKKSVAWEDLHMIAQEIATRHTHCPFSVIAEKISSLINLPDVAA